MIYIDEQLGELRSAIGGACFHGEVWVRCPHCGWGHEMMGERPKFTRDDGTKIYECKNCGELFYDI